jgi:hypothetical protein
MSLQVTFEGLERDEEVERGQMVKIVETLVGWVG